MRAAATIFSTEPNPRSEGNVARHWRFLVILNGGLTKAFVFELVDEEGFNIADEIVDIDYFSFDGWPMLQRKPSKSGLQDILTVKSRGFGDWLLMRWYGVECTDGKE